MDIETILAENLTKYNLNPYSTKNNESLLDTSKTLYRKLEKLESSCNFKGNRHLYAIDVAAKLHGFQIDCSKQYNISSADYLRNLGMIRTSLGIQWNAVSLETLAVKFNPKFSREVKYVLLEYNKSITSPVANILTNAVNLCAASSALIQVKKEFPTTEKEALKKLSESTNVQAFHALITTYKGIIEKVTPEEWRALAQSDSTTGNSKELSDNPEPGDISRFIKSMTASNSNRDTTKSNNSSSSSSNSNNVSNTSSSAPVDRLAATIRGNRQVSAAGVDLNQKRSFDENQRRSVEESVARKRIAYEVWREKVLSSASQTDTVAVVTEVQIN